jgi:hypothetical protein
VLRECQHIHRLVARKLVSYERVYERWRDRIV